MAAQESLPVEGLQFSLPASIANYGFVASWASRRE